MSEAPEKVETDLVLGWGQLEISPAVTPGLHDTLRAVSGRFGLGSTRVRAFVRSTPEVQAMCLFHGPDRCWLVFSSGLVELLSSEEFAFVCGHELAHFLLLHGPLGRSHSGESIRAGVLSRSREISADRFGLLACGSADAALRAVVKILSGLGDRHLRFDYAGINQQLRAMGPGGSGLFSSQSHPSLLIRARALLWTASVPLTEVWEGENETTSLDDIDGRISRDLERWVDGWALAQIEDRAEGVLLWTFAREIVGQGRYSSRLQEVALEWFGQETAGRLKDFLSTLDRAEASDVVNQRLIHARSRLEEADPFSFERVASEAIAKVGAVMAVTDES